VASHTINGQVWADGTVVGVYPAASMPVSASVPSGTAVVSATVTSGAVTFSGLAPDVRYVAYAGGVARRFLIPSVNPMDARSIRTRVDELEGEVGPTGRVGAVVAGTPTDLSWLAATGRAATDGDEALDSTSGLLYVRVGGAWKYAPLNAAGVVATGAGVLVNGAVTDAGFLAAAGRAAVDGDRALDYANARWYVRTAGAWQYAALSSPAAFTPASISGLYAWYDASQIVGKVDGDAISQWDDLSGNARHLLQATGSKQPLYKAAVQNGKPVVRFDGVDDDLTAALAATLAQPFTIVVVGRASTGTSTNENFTASPSGNVFVAGRTGGGGVYSIQGGTPFTQISAGRKENAFKLITAIFNGATSEIHVNGATTAGSLGTTGYATPLRVGSLGGTTEFLNGDVAELIVYSKALNSTEVGQIEAYLA
jgi:hypothetical protein